jgi:hypothetical protein
MRDWGLYIRPDVLRKLLTSLERINDHRVVFACPPGVPWEELGQAFLSLAGVGVLR